MSEYKPDRWVVLKLKSKNEHIYKVMGGWYGGYLGSDSWRINSGITKVELDGDDYVFYGYSGSTYVCNKNSYGATFIMLSVLPGDDSIVKIMDQTDFTKLEL
jgi:hypothetical protein